MWWPGRRRRQHVDKPPSTTLRAQRHAEPAEPPGWTTLPPLQPTGSAPPTLARLESFGGSLSTHQDPRFLESLGHYVVEGAPGGQVDGLVSLTPAVQRWIGPDPSPAPMNDGPATAALPWSLERATPAGLRPAEGQVLGQDTPTETHHRGTIPALSTLGQEPPAAAAAPTAPTAPIAPPPGAETSSAEPPRPEPVVAPIAAQRSGAVDLPVLAEHLPQARPITAESMMRAPAGSLPPAQVRHVPVAEQPAQAQSAQPQPQPAQPLLAQRALEEHNLDNANIHTRGDVRAGGEDGPAASSSPDVVPTLGAASEDAGIFAGGNVPLREGPDHDSALPIQRAIPTPTSPPATLKPGQQPTPAPQGVVTPGLLHLPGPELLWPRDKEARHIQRSLPVLPLSSSAGTATPSGAGTEPPDVGRPGPAPSPQASPPAALPAVQRVVFGEPLVTAWSEAPAIRPGSAVTPGPSGVVQRQLAAPGHGDTSWRSSHPRSAAPLAAATVTAPIPDQPVAVEWRSDPVQRTVSSGVNALPMHGRDASQEEHLAESRTPPLVARSFAQTPVTPPVSVQAFPELPEEVRAAPAAATEALGDAASAITETVATAATPASGTPPASAATGTSNLDELARRLYEPLSARLRAELWLDRERSGRTLSR